MDSSQLVKSDHEKTCTGIINDVHHPYSCGEVCIWASKQMAPQSVLVGASFQHSFKCDYVITSFKSHSYVGDAKPRWRYENIFQVQRYPSIAYWDGLWLTLPPIWSEFACSSDYLSLNTIALSSLIHHLIVFHCPLANLNTTCFFSSSGPPYCPQLLNFSRSVEDFNVIFIKDFADSIDVLLCPIIFLVLESNQIFQRSCLFKFNCWNEIREMLVLEKIFWKSSFFDQRSNIHYSM